METAYDMIDNNPIRKMIFLVVVGVLLYLFFRVLDRYVLVLVKDRKYVQMIERWDFRVRFAAWAGYSSWALFHLIKVNFLLTIVVLAVVFIAGFKSWMQAFSGLMIRLERRFRLGDSIRTSHGNGQVAAFYMQSLGVLNESGELLSIPYTEVAFQPYARQTDRALNMPDRFEISWPYAEPENALGQLRQWAEQCPWTASVQPVQVSQTESGSYQLSVFPVDRLALRNIEKYVKSKMEHHENN